MAELSDVDLLRLYLDDSIPDGGSADDAHFSADDVDTFLAQAENNIDRAAAIGWRTRAGQFAKLVSVSEGSSKRSLEQKHKNALNMAKVFEAKSVGVATTRIREISREGSR